MPKHSYSLVARFLTNEEKEWFKTHGGEPIVNGNTVTYGLYPQTYVSDADTIDALNRYATEVSGSYYQYFGRCYSYQNEYYVKYTAAPYKNTYRFPDYSYVVSGTDYWFKCEPLTWNILSINEDEYLLLSSKLLFPSKYSNKSHSEKPYTYSTSKVRELITSAVFLYPYSIYKYDDELIQTTLVDNTTLTNDSPLYSEDTYDKAFLLSWADYKNTDYGFYSKPEVKSSTRVSYVTDFALAMGAEVSGTYENYAGRYWTRSPCNNDYSYVYAVASNGLLYYHDFYTANTAAVCVRPAIVLKIPNN